MDKIIVRRDETFLPALEQAISTNQSIVDWNLFKLNYTVRKATITTDFASLHAPSYLPKMEFLEHQIETATTVMNEMNGRAILADEVGLGKTIEAGLILKEYMIRGLVKNALLLVPASLVNQWIQELNEKFYIPAVAYRKNYQWSDYPLFVTSIDLAKKEPHRTALLDLHFDLVIVDEAHKLKNQETLNYSLVSNLKKKYCLLLTATPIQNRVSELFNLVSILKPGYLGNYADFRAKYGKDEEILEQSLLQQLIRKVMVRNSRKDTILDNIKRHVHNIWIDLKEEEKEAYQALKDYLQTFPALTRITFLKELCSSREACFMSLEKTELAKDKEANTRILHTIATLPHHSKAEKLLELIQDIGPKKVIIFTEYRASQYYLQRYLQAHQISSVIFRGGLKAGRKEWITELFKSNVQVFIATEAGAEGINLQFCNHLINYDLPWNPMRLEQRIGRIHRYGQMEDIQIYNLAIKDTIEEHIMDILYKKLNIFEEVIGKLDQILARLNIKNVEDEFKLIIDESNSTGEMQVKLNNLLAVIHENHHENQELNHGTS